MKRSVEQRLYRQSVEKRDVIFKPLAKILTFFRITPFMITLLGFVSMFLFALALEHNRVLSLFFLLLSVLFDLIDGVLARYQEKASDKGKFADMVFDNLSFTVFVVGLVFVNLVDALPALLIVYFMLLSKVLRSVNNAFSLNSDWRFKTVAGFLPNLIVGLSYALFLFYAVTDIILFSEFFGLFAVVLIIDSIVFYGRIMKK